MDKPTIARHWLRYQPLLFPELLDDIGPLTDRHRQFVLVLDTLLLERVIFDGSPPTGRKPCSRLAIAKCFVGKAVFNLPTNEMLLDRLHIDKVFRRIVGFEKRRDIPCLATFSNAFREFSESQTLERIHGGLVKYCFQEKIVGHVSRDATAIAAREKIAVKPKTEPQKKRGYGRGRPRKGEVRIKEPHTRIEKQQVQSLEQMLADLPRLCDAGSKKSSKGHPEHWFGYKLHLDVDDNGLPLACILTSASLNDSQCAIPLEKITASRVTSLYSLMDKGYDAEGIRAFVRKLEKVPIIKPRNFRCRPSIPLDPASELRFARRTTVERAFSDLKDNYGARSIRVRGAKKVMTHLMFGVLALFASGQLTHFI